MQACLGHPRLYPAIARMERFVRAARLGPLIASAFLSAAFGLVTLDAINYEPPIKKISGQIVGVGPVNPVDIKVYRLKQNQSDYQLTDSTGKFDFPGIVRGSYEVRFSGRDGWKTLALLVTVDPAGSKDQLCVNIGREGTHDESSVQPCK